MRRHLTGCRLSTRIGLLLFALAAAGAPDLQAQDHVHPAGDVDGVGRVAFAVTCSPDATSRFGRAVAMLHSFWFEAAEAEFSAILDADPTCAMAHWGRAMTLMGNPMTRAAPAATAMAEGAAAAQRAAASAAGVSHRERMYIDAALAFYGDPQGRDHAARSAALEQALEALYTAHADDDEAAIFYGRTLVANAPPDDHTFSRQLKAAAMMEPLFERYPDHPGLAHYLIHAYDAPQLAEHGTHAARAYAAIAPDAPHALHMPSHIFTRLGYWDESIETNARSALAEPDPDAAVHPMDYKVYAYLQQGRDTEAKRVLDRAVQNPDRFYGGLLGYNFTAMPARFALERGAWADAAGLRLPVGALPYVEAITRFARAVGAARAGDPAAAKQDVEALDGLHRQLADRGDREWATRVEAQYLAAAAWVAYANADRDEALRLARAGADREDTIEKHPVTPGPLLPARELLGDLLIELDQPDSALREYEKTLQREPRRARTLHGAARAAELVGNADVAARHYTELLEVMSKADADRREAADARRFLDRVNGA